MTKLELLDDWWVLGWFVVGMMFFIMATISVFNNETDKCIACIGVCLACHTRSEVAMLRKKIEKGSALTKDD